MNVPAFDGLVFDKAATTEMLGHARAADIAPSVVYSYIRVLQDVEGDASKLPAHRYNIKLTDDLKTPEIDAMLRVASKAAIPQEDALNYLTELL